MDIKERQAEIGKRTEPADSQFHINKIEKLEKLTALGERLPQRDATERRLMVSKCVLFCNKYTLCKMLRRKSGLCQI